MDEITIYQKPTCSKCRETMQLLRSKGVEIHAINYLLEPIAAEKIRELLGKLGIPAIELFRKKEPRFRELRIDENTQNEDELIGILAANPELIERPIVVRGKKAVLGRPPENILKLF